MDIGILTSLAAVVSILANAKKAWEFVLVCLKTIQKKINSPRVTFNVTTSAVLKKQLISESCIRLVGISTACLCALDFLKKPHERLVCPVLVFLPV